MAHWKVPAFIKHFALWTVEAGRNLSRNTTLPARIRRHRRMEDAFDVDLVSLVLIDCWLTWFAFVRNWTTYTRWRQRRLKRRATRAEGACWFDAKISEIRCRSQWALQDLNNWRLQQQWTSTACFTRMLMHRGDCTHVVRSFKDVCLYTGYRYILMFVCGNVMQCDVL